MALRRINPTKKPLNHLPRTFSSSNPPFPPPPSDEPDASPRSPPPNNADAPQKPPSTLFADLRERLRSSSAPSPPPPRRIPLTPPIPTGQAPMPPLDDIKRSLESFRAVTRNPNAPPPRPSDGPAPLFQDLLKKSVAPAARPQGTDGAKTPFSFNLGSLRESLNKLSPPQPQRQPFLTPNSHSIFNKELQKEQADGAVRLLNEYTHEDLGRELAKLRPPGAGKDGKDWFSLHELQGRIAKLAQQETDQRHEGKLKTLSSSILHLRDTEKRKSTISMGGIFSLANLTGKRVPDYMSQPPQEELLERYFHPDHMSGEEKMKLELQKVRDEFKMSENDCGSARVQIAQLTLKIKHLSSVLHKKDKHSRKGLQDMVQRRKKYLKYLRRTDWDSYCMVLEKLGLRDIPEYKAPDYKKTQPTKAQSKKSKSKRKRKMKA